MCRYNGVVYTSCTTVDQAAAWCATQVDAGGNFVTDQYGFCPRSVQSVELSTRTFAKFHVVPGNCHCKGKNHIPI